MIAKTIILTLAMAGASVAAVGGVFTTYFGENCSVLGGSGSVVEGYCVNVEDFPYSGFEGYVTSGECEDSSATPVIHLYIAPNCDTVPAASFAIGGEPKCVSQTISAQSVTLECVTSD